MIVIADTSPILYAVMIGQDGLFFRLYGKLTLPVAVFRELTDPGSPTSVHAWVKVYGQLISIVPVEVPSDGALDFLGRGECEAITLALQQPDSLLIMDERLGREEARRRGIRTTGLLGTIRDAAVEGYLDFEESVAKLRRTSFRMSEEVLSMVRREYVEKSGKS